MAKEISLTKGKVAIVDDEDYEFLSMYKWHVLRNKYAVRSVRENGSKRMVYMHREIMNPDVNLQVDHVNGNGLDNRKVNLRNVTQRQNLYNQGTRSDNTSGYKGVYKTKNNKWYAEVKKDYKKINLGVFESKHDAARMYNFWAYDMFGEFAKLNVIKESE